MDSVPPFQSHIYEIYFRAAYGGLFNKIVEATVNIRKTQLQNWYIFVAPLGVDLYL